jgi:hypothetical protein
MLLLSDPEIPLRTRIFLNLGNRLLFLLQIPGREHPTWGVLHIPAKRFNPGSPLPLLSVFLDHMQVGEVQINGRGTEPLMAEALLSGGQRDAFRQGHRGKRVSTMSLKT